MKRSKKAEADERQERNAALLKMRFGRRFTLVAAKTKDWADDLDVDRFPMPRVDTLLITVEDLVRLLDQGLEVRLYRAYALNRSTRH
jgi:hypothetical protein